MDGVTILLLSRQKEREGDEATRGLSFSHGMQQPFFLICVENAHSIHPQVCLFVTFSLVEHENKKRDRVSIGRRSSFFAEKAELVKEQEYRQPLNGKTLFWPL